MLLAFAACLRRAGVNAIHLGADVPLDDWKTVASEVGARAAVLGVHLEEGVETCELEPPDAHNLYGAKSWSDGLCGSPKGCARRG
jgi:hypothetical protein